MTFYVYRRVKHRLNAWELASEHESEAEAVAAARAICSKGRDIHTGPSRELAEAFFGAAGSDRWSVMITTRPVAR